MSDLLPESSTPIDASELRHALVHSFNLGELKTICQDVGINHENIGESRIEAFARELVLTCQRRGLLLKLVESSSRRRPHTNWYAFIGQEPPDEPSPFKGLSFFDEADAPLFFGRDELTAELVAHLREHRFLAVVGASGSGKSSVVRAGVVPALRSETGWPIHIINPTDDPLKALAEPLTRNVESVTAFATLIDDLTHRPRALELFVSRRMAQQKWPGILLIIDQFEELFTLCKDEQKRHAFVDNLVNAAQAHDGLTVVLTLRADFYHHCLQYEALHTLLEQRQKIVPAMNVDQLRTAIETPAARAGIQFEDGLVDLILRDVGATETQMPEPGALPLLSHALLETWRRRDVTRLTLAGYHAAGGVHGAIAQTAETVYRQFDEAQQKVARSVFLRLTELGEGTQDTRRRAGLDELIPQNETAQDVTAVIQMLADARLVTTGNEGAEVAHEALIREWPTLRHWLETDREGLRIHRQLTEAAQRWQQNAQDSSYLYRGTRLAQADEWFAVNEADLNELEQAFLAASGKQEARKQRRQRLRRLGLVGGLVLVIGILVVAVVLIQNEAKKTERQRKIALAQSVTALSSLVLDQENDTELAMLLAIEGARLNWNNKGGVDWLIDSTLRLQQDEPFYFNNTLRGHEDWVLSVAFSPDGKTLASGREDGTVRLWDVNNPGVEPVVLQGQAGVVSVVFSLDGRTLAGGNFQEVRLWDMSAPGSEPVILQGHEGWIRSVAFSPDGQMLASGSDDQTIRLWDLNNPGVEPIMLLGHEGEVNSVAFSPDGQMLVSGSADQTVRLWDLNNPGVDPVVLRGHESWVRSVVFSPGGNTLASGSADQTVRLWDLNNPGADPVVLRGHESWVSSVAFSPDGQMLASGSVDGTIRLWDVRNPGTDPVMLRGHGDWVLSVVFSLDGQTLASGSFDQTVRLWDMSNLGAEPVVLPGHVGWIRSVTFSPDGEMLASGGVDQTIRLWDLNNPGAELVALRGHESSVRSVAFSPDGETLASGSDDQTIRLWDVSNPGSEPVVLRGHEATVWSVAFSPDGQTLASGSFDQTVRLWNVKNLGLEPVVLWGHESSVSSVAFSPDGNTLASGSDDQTIRLWDVKNPGSEPVVLRGHEFEFNSVAFSLDGETIASGSSDDTIRLWDVRNPGAAPVVLRGHENGVESVAFSPDGETIASGSSDDTIRLWDVKNPGSEPVVLRGHENIVLSVAFSPDGQTLASGSGDETIRLWSMLERMVEVGCTQFVRRNLTWEEWQRYLPGEPYRQTCPNLPPHFTVP